MATEKWIDGGQASYASVTITLTSLGSGNAIMASADIDNSTNLDMFCDFSFAIGSAAFTGTPFLGLYFYPLNEDGTTYGDGRFGSAAAGPPPPNYFVGYAGLVAATQAQTGFFSVPGMVAPIRMPKGIFRPVIHNGGGVALAASANALKYRTFNRQVA